MKSKGGSFVCPEGQSDEQITVQGQTGVPVQDLWDGGMVGSGWAGNLEGTGQTKNSYQCSVDQAELNAQNLAPESVNSL